MYQYISCDELLVYCNINMGKTERGLVRKKTYIVFLPVGQRSSARDLVYRVFITLADRKTSFFIRTIVSKQKVKDSIIEGYAFLNSR